MISNTLEVIKLLEDVVVSYKAASSGNWLELLKPESLVLLQDIRDALKDGDQVPEELLHMNAEDAGKLYQRLVHLVGLFL